MSRKWERMVERNTKRMNQERTKNGQTHIGVSADGSVRIRGRSWVFPLVLATAGLLFAFTVPPGSEADAFYQITVGLYLVLALIHFFLRRPYLNISKKDLSWRTYAGERVVPASDIASIRIGEKKSVVELKDGKTKRSFSKAYHLFPMEQLNVSLSKFAAAHQIPVNETTKEI